MPPSLSHSKPTNVPAALWISDAVAAALVALALSFTVTAVQSGNTTRIEWGAFGMVVAAVLRAAFQMGATLSGQRLAERIKRQWRERIYEPVLASRAGDRRMLGEQIADAIDRIEDVDGHYSRFLPLRKAAALAPLLIAGLVMLASPVSGAILLVTLLPFILGMALAGSAAAKASARQFEAMARMSGLFIDRIRALPIIVGFGAEERVTRQLSTATQAVAEHTLRVLRVAFVSTALVEFFAALSVALVAVYCGFNLLGLLPFPSPEHLDLGRALFVLALAPEFYLPMRRLAAAYHDKQAGEAAEARLKLIAARQSSVPQDVLTAPSLRFDRVVIDYGARSIGPFTLDVPSKKLTVMTGETGAGKSSLLAALLGLAPLSGGSIWLDGEVLTMGARVGDVSWAGQVTALIPGTFAENIAIAKPNAGRTEIEQAANNAGLAPMIASRPLGLDTPVDYRGAGLSGGERRRIGIARALLRNAPLWLLDEPTADLDEASALEIEEILCREGQGRTLLIVTHSQRLARRADHHVVLT
eukprot:gene15316-15461_t